MTGALILLLLFLVVGYPMLSPIFRRPDVPYFYSESGSRP